MQRAITSRTAAKLEAERARRTNPAHDDATYQRVADETLVGRWGTPEEMGQAVLFLVEADYITGEVLTVDGGQRFGHRKHVHG